MPSDIIQSKQLQLDHIPMCLLIVVDGSSSKFWPHIFVQSNSQLGNTWFDPWGAPGSRTPMGAYIFYDGLGSNFSF